MESLIAQGKAVWSPFSICSALADEGNVAKVAHMWCGLPDTCTYSSLETMSQGFRQTCAFKPRILVDSNSEDMWHCWLLDRDYCKTFGEASLEDGDMLKLLDVNDQEEEHLTVAQFLAFCDQGLEGLGDKEEWRSAAVGGYFDNEEVSSPSMTFGRGGCQLVDLRYRPNRRTGLRFLVARNEVCVTIVQQTHQAAQAQETNTGSPLQARSLVLYILPNSPEEGPEHRSLRQRFEEDLPSLLAALDVSEVGVPLLWSCDFEMVDGAFIITQFNGSCVDLPMFEAACGSDSDLYSVSNDDFMLGMDVVDMIGRKALEFVEQARARRGLQGPGPSIAIPGVVGAGGVYSGVYDYNGAIPEEEEAPPS